MFSLDVGRAREGTSANCSTILKVWETNFSADWTDQLSCR